jgi:pimeloyl-ACP methyl ester carboxylesterase
MELLSVLGGKAPPSRAASALLPPLGPVYERSSDLKRIDGETLLLWGERDPVVPVDVAKAALAQMPRGRLVVEPGLGHELYIESPARVATLLSSFLS